MLELTFGNKKIATELPAFVMGILNATPDSFYDISRGGLERAIELVDASQRPAHGRFHDRIRSFFPARTGQRSSADIPR